MKKKEKLFRAMEEIEDAFIEEADPNRPKARQSKKVLKWSVLAACICLVCASVGLFVFLSQREKPLDKELAEYRESPYYEIIEKLYPVVTRPRGNAVITAAAYAYLSQEEQEPQTRFRVVSFGKTGKEKIRNRQRN